MNSGVRTAKFREATRVTASGELRLAEEKYAENFFNAPTLPGVKPTKRPEPGVAGGGGLARRLQFDEVADATCHTCGVPLK